MGAVQLTAAGHQLAQGTAECLGLPCTAAPVRMIGLLTCMLLDREVDWVQRPPL